MAAAPNTYGCSLHHIRLQPVLPTVAAFTTYGCSLYCLRLQVGPASHGGATLRSLCLCGVSRDPELQSPALLAIATW